jgi:hypothetical protein
LLQAAPIPINAIAANIISKMLELKFTALYDTFAPAAALQSTKIKINATGSKNSFLFIFYPP